MSFPIPPVLSDPLCLLGFSAKLCGRYTAENPGLGLSVVMPAHSDLTTEDRGTGRREAAVPDGRRPLQGGVSLNIFAVSFAGPISLEVRT